MSQVQFLKNKTYESKMNDGWRWRVLVDESANSLELKNVSRRLSLRIRLNLYISFSLALGLFVPPRADSRALFQTPAGPWLASHPGELVRPRGVPRYWGHPALLLSSLLSSSTYPVLTDYRPQTNST